MALNCCRVPYVVSGAFALQVHTGIWRPTKDLDLFLIPEDVPAAFRCLTKRGFRCRVKDPVWLHKAHRNGFFIDMITGMSNAVITVERSWIENSRPALVLDVRARVLAAEELLASKLFVVRRERFDGADIAHIIFATRGTSTGSGSWRWLVSTGKSCCSRSCCTATFTRQTVDMYRPGYGNDCWFASPMS
jgi:hypothetical protein